MCSKNFFQAWFSQPLIFAWRGHFQELQINNNWVDFSQIWTDIFSSICPNLTELLIIINKNMSGVSIILKILSLKAISVHSCFSHSFENVL